MLRATSKMGVKLPLGERLVCYTSLCVFTPLLAIMGSASAVNGILMQWSDGASNPFSGCVH